MPLLTPDELRAHLPAYAITDEQANSAIRLVSGWLLEATGLDELPDPAAAPEPDLLWSAALELAALVVTNPESLASKTVGPTGRQWPMNPRATAILERVSRHFQGPGALARGDGFGSFPDAATWPDPPSIAGWGTTW